MNSIKVLVIGGDSEGYHDFSVLGPFYKQLLEKNAFRADLSVDMDILLPGNIDPYDMVISVLNAADLNRTQAGALCRAVTGGKSFIGVHCASVCPPEMHEYMKMIGGRFLTHPPLGPVCRIKIMNPFHPITRSLNDFDIIDELYLMETYPPIEILLSSDFSGFERPLAWVKPYGLGRIFYISLGHGREQVENTEFQKIILNAVRWCAGEFLGTV